MSKVYSQSFFLLCRPFLCDVGWSRRQECQELWWGSIAFNRPTSWKSRPGWLPGNSGKRPASVQWVVD